MHYITSVTQEHSVKKSHARGKHEFEKHIVCSCLEALVQNNLLSSWGWEMEEGGV